MDAAQGRIAACGSDAMPEQASTIAEDGDPVAEALSAAQAPPAAAVETSSSDIVESSPVHGMLQRRRRHASLPVCLRKESPIVRGRRLWQQLVERMEAEWALITLRQGSWGLLFLKGRVHVLATQLHATSAPNAATRAAMLRASLPLCSVWLAKVCVAASNKNLSVPYAQIF